MVAATTRLGNEGMSTDVEEHTTCCFAVQDKVWVDGPDSSRWEIYTVLDDAPLDSGIAGDGQCCGAKSSASTLTVAERSCC